MFLLRLTSTVHIHRLLPMQGFPTRLLPAVHVRILSCEVSQRIALSAGRLTWPRRMSTPGFLPPLVASRRHRRPGPKASILKPPSNSLPFAVGSPFSGLCCAGFPTHVIPALLLLLFFFIFDRFYDVLNRYRLSYADPLFYSPG